MKNSKKKDRLIKLPNIENPKKSFLKNISKYILKKNDKTQNIKKDITSNNNSTTLNFRPQTSYSKNNILKNSTQTTENEYNNTTHQNFRTQTAKIRNYRSIFIKPPRLFSPIKREKYSYKGKLLPPIPKNLLDRLNLLRTIFTSINFLNFIHHAPSKQLNNIETISKYLFQYNNNYVDLTHYASIFYYVCTQMNYDYKEINKDQKDYEIIFKSGLCNNIQFCKIFEYMCKVNNLKFKHIKGYCKLLDKPFKKDTNVLQINHYWVAIFIQGEWYFCDPLFGSGGIDKNEELKEKNFNPYFFITQPEFLIETHRPIDDDWQFLPKIITTKQFINKRFINLHQFYKNVYEYEIELLTHTFPIIHCNMNLVIKLKLKNMLIQCSLFQGNLKTKISEVKFNYNNKKNIYSLEPTFPKKGEYYICISFHPYGSNNIEYKPLINYKVIVDDSQEKYLEQLKKERRLKKKKKKFLEELKLNRPKSVRIPSMGLILEKEEAFKKIKSKICLDNYSAHLIEPKNGSSSVKIGVETKFKIKLDDNSIGCCILDGYDFIYLKKKDEHIWEGNVIIKNENFTICSLKPNNVLTEVFKMNAHYATSKLLRMSNNFKGRSKDKF